MLAGELVDFLDCVAEITRDREPICSECQKVGLLGRDRLVVLVESAAKIEDARQSLEERRTRVKETE